VAGADPVLGSQPAGEEVTFLTLFINICPSCWLFDTTALSSVYLTALIMCPSTETPLCVTEVTSHRCFIIDDVE